MSRTLLHVATDWPGHFPGVAATIAALIQAGADVNARFRGPHVETPLHWAASSDDLDAIDALLDAGADTEADGGVIGGGTPLDDARAFGQWRATRRLVERGARTTIADAASLGLADRLEQYFGQEPEPSADEISRAFWGACHGGQRLAAEYLLDRGADLSWIPPWKRMSPLDAAVRSEDVELVRRAARCTPIAVRAKCLGSESGLSQRLQARWSSFRSVGTRSRFSPGRKRMPSASGSPAG